MSEKYTLMVEDNSQSGDPYESGNFTTYADAVEAAKRLVDDFLQSNYTPRLTAEELYKQYTLFGEDAFVMPSDGSFSAWDYARQQSEILCQSTESKTLLGSLHRLIRSRGLVRPCRTYSMVVKPGELLLLCTGRSAAPNMLFTPGSRYHAAALAMQALYEPTIKQNEKEIMTGNEGKVLQDKNSFLFLFSQIQDIRVEERPLLGDVLFLTAQNKKYRFFFERNRLQEVKNFVEKVNAART